MSTSIDELSARIEHLQAQLDELKAQLKAAQADGGATSVAQLYGALGGTLNASEADLEAVEIKLDWDKLNPPA